MRRIGRPPITKMLPLLLVTIALASSTTLFPISKSQTYIPSSASQIFATANATATGTVSVLWGDPYLPAQTSQGTGLETISVQGHVSPRPDLKGAYTYNDPATWGELDVDWSTVSENYSVDVYFYQGHSPYNRTTIFPDPANTFAAMYIYFRGQLIVNGATSEIHGLAAVVAAAPGFFGFRGTARAISIVLYSPTYHGDQYVFRWSQTDQTINGIEQPMSTTCESAVHLANGA